MADKFDKAKAKLAAKLEQNRERVKDAEPNRGRLNREVPEKPGNHTKFGEHGQNDGA